MTEETSTLSFSQSVGAPPEELFRAFTNSTCLREWLCDIATTSPRVGGHIFLAWNDGYGSHGVFTALKENEHVAFGWHGTEPAATTVEVSLSPEGKGTKVTLTHAGMGVGSEWQATRQEIAKGWQMSLENLTSLMETGEDLRFTRRPMLGIMVGEFNKEMAAKLAVPVHEAIRLDGVVPEMGAAAAGLEANDVIVRIGEQPVTDWPSLQGSLQELRAGDTVLVEFYRDGRKQSLDMKLSGRPIPVIPGTAAELAAQVRERHEQASAELEKFFDGVSEEEAGFHPAEGEWSAKEVLAHLIHGEQGWRSYMSDLIGSQEPLYDDFGGNIAARIAGTLAVYPTARSLLNAFEREQFETAAMLENLPASFLARKGSYWRLAYGVLEAPYHHRSHLEQMQAAVAAARQT